MKESQNDASGLSAVIGLLSSRRWAATILPWIGEMRETGRPSSGIGLFPSVCKVHPVGQNSSAESLQAGILTTDDRVVPSHLCYEDFQVSDMHGDGLRFGSLVTG